MAIGDIGSLLDSLVVDPADLIDPSVALVFGDIYVVAYAGPGSDGWLKTFSISPSGEISATFIDSFEFDPDYCMHPVVCRVSPNIFAVAYARSDWKGVLFSVYISDAGVIIPVMIDSLIFDDGAGVPGSILLVGPGCVAVAYSDGAGAGWCKTALVSSRGEIPAAVVDSLQFDAVTGLNPFLLSVSGVIYAVAYSGAGDVGNIVSFSISSVGDISAAAIDSLVFDAATGLDPTFVNVLGDFFAIAYRGPGYVGYLKTFSITAAGAISDAVIDSFVFDAAGCFFPCIASLGPGYFAVAYTGAGNVGLLKTFPMDASGFINSTILDSFTFEALFCNTPVLFHISQDVYSILYTFTSAVGNLVSLPISSNWPALYHISGTIHLKGVPIEAQVRCYIRSTGVLYDSVVSSPDGTFSLSAPDDSTELFVIAFDNPGGDVYNALIYDLVLGTLI